MTPPSQHAHKRQCQAQARERKIGGRGVEKESGVERKEKKPSNE